MREISLKDIYESLLRRMALVVVFPVIAVIVTAAIVFFVEDPVYTSSASMYVLNKQNTENNSINYSDLQSSAMLTADYREIILSKRVLSEVAEEYHMSVAAIKSGTRVSTANDTRVLVISVTMEDPVLAANLANAIGKEFAITVVEIMEVDNVSFVDYAELSTRPSAPDKANNILIAGVLGLIVGMVIAACIDIFNTTIRTVDDVEKHLNLTVLARIPRIEEKKNGNR